MNQLHFCSPFSINFAFGSQCDRSDRVERAYGERVRVLRILQKGIHSYATTKIEDEQTHITPTT
jgi:hypothetical protein